MVRMSSKEDLNVPTYLIEHLLAIIKITNESPNLFKRKRTIQPFLRRLKM